MPPLLRVRQDTQWQKEVHTAKWGEPVDVALWESEDHRTLIIRRAQAEWIEAMHKREGWEYAGGGMKVEPVVYVTYDGSGAFDPGPVAPPPPNQATPERLAAYEKAERARAAAAKTTDAEQAREVVDFRLTATFWTPKKGLITKPSSLIQPSKN